MVVMLHLSDLHRAKEHHVSNVALINSLEVDCNRYCHDLNISLPQLIVVSGDIIFGTTSNEGGFDKDISEQYNEAHDFLVQLTDKFLSGDRSKIIIVPGNHDVDWYYSQKSMEAIELDEVASEQKSKKREMLRAIYKNDSSIRWSWNDFQFYKIANDDFYKKRFEGFSEFYSRFYNGERDFSLNPDNQYNIFDYPEFNLTVVGFNSCYRNDHCNNMGKINPNCIAKAAIELRTTRYNNRLFVAVWHHNTSGKPNETDYMDFRTLQNLIDSNYRIGLHGHQHKTEIVYESFLLNSEQKIVVISAGSLCAGPESLPPGETRKYNLITLDLSSCTAVLYIRKMLDGNFDLPIWGLEKKEDISFYQLQKKEVEDPIKELIHVEDFIVNKDYDKAIELLEKMDSTEDTVRYFLLECYNNKSQTKKITKLINPPKSNKEIIYLMHAFWEEKEIENLRALLKDVENSEDPIIKEEYQKFFRRLNYI